MPEIQYKVDLPAFTGRNVPIKEIAKAMGKDAQYVRVGIQQGVLKFGVAIKMEDSNEYNYYCPDKKVWEETKQVLIKGLEINVVNGKQYNNFPKASNNPVSHVRPHAQNSNDTYELPDGRRYPKQCFWLNNTYILSQLNESFLKEK